MSLHRTLAALALSSATLAAAPALAQDVYYDEEAYYEEFGADGYEDGYVGEPAYYEEELPPPPRAPMPPAPSGPRVGYSPQEREAWLLECRDRMTPRDDGVGGAVIGGVIGGVAGNRIAGRGHRTEGTIIGAGVGAVAGAAIDRAEDYGDANRFCEDYLERYEASIGDGYAQGGGSYAYSAGGHGYQHHGGAAYVSGPVMWVPVVISGGCRSKRCGCDDREEVVEEWIEEEAPPPARRVVPRRDKRVKIQRYVK